MSENSFIRFSETITDTECEKAVPVCDINELKFFFGEGQAPYDNNELDIVTPDGTRLIMGGNDSDCVQDNHFNNNLSSVPFFQPLHTRLAEGDCFRLRSFSQQGVLASNEYVSDEIHKQQLNIKYSEYLAYFDFNFEQGKQYRLKLNYSELYRRDNGQFIEKFIGELPNGMNVDLSNVFSAYFDINERYQIFDSEGYALRDYETTFLVFEIQNTYIQIYGAFDIKVSITFEEITGDGVDIYSFSNLLRYEPTDGLALLEYWCDTPEFGFNYDHDQRTNAVRVPIHLKEPQYKQKDKLYERLDGSRVVLYSEINKEYEAETEYLNEETHRKIIVALAHDHVRINGEDLMKTDSYEIEWDNTITSPCGEKLAKAKFKVSRNEKVRNSNCG